MRTGVALSVVTALALVAARPAAAQGWRGRCGGQASFAGLDLTADQQQKLSALRGEVDRKMDPLRDEMSAKSDELRQLWRAPKPDKKAIETKQAQLDQVRKQMQEARTGYRLASLDVLTPAQREKLQASGGPGDGPPCEGCQGGGWCGENGGGCGGGPCGMGQGAGGCGGGPGRGHRHAFR